MDFSLFPPEINSGLMYSGAGVGPLLEAAQAWNTLATELYSTALAHTSVTTALTASWNGPSSSAAFKALGTYGAWLQTSAAQAEATAAQATAAAGAYSSAYAATVAPPLIAANRAQLLMLVASNLLGQNTAAIAANEAAYAQMWAQDAAAMNAYATSSSAATSGLPQFTTAPQTTTGSTSSAATSAALPNWLNNSTTIGQLIQSLISSGFPIDVAQLFVNFIALQEVAASNVEAAQIRANIPPPPVIIPAAPTPSAPMPAPPPVKASKGCAGNLGRMSVPPSWARPPDVAPSREPAPITQERGRYQAAIPAVPFMPVTGLRSNQGRVREDPEYGHVSRVTPPLHPHPSAG